MKSTLLPLALVWLAVHAAILAVILSLKFLTAKALLMVLMAGTALWFLTGKRRRLALPPPPGMV
ncbi:MAG: hypothetical protein H0U98_08840 [Alphaproteobacteria bacterium]|nr:hypothetical protein [Alphaproteobacteria bacterium]